MARHSRSFRRPLKNRYIWELSNGNFPALAAGQSALNFSVVGTQQSTLTRIRGTIRGYLDGQPLPGGLAEITWGIILVPEGSSTTVQFNPFSDANAPWLLWGSSFIGYEEPVTDVIDIPGMTSFSIDVDNKAQRIIRPDLEMQFVVNNSTVLAAVSVNVQYSLRWLQITGKR